jgi:predicted DNA-binding protein (MmcQ/YjbR family)
MRERLREHALSLPGAYEDHPWGESVAKVGTKVFVFLGGEDDPGMTVKLPDSHAHALTLPGATPTGYGLGRSGWVTVRLRGKLPPAAVLMDFVDESYRAVAPKKMVAALDSQREPRASKRSSANSA